MNDNLNETSIQNALVLSSFKWILQKIAKPFVSRHKGVRWGPKTAEVLIFKMVTFALELIYFFLEHVFNVTFRHGVLIFLLTCCFFRFLNPKYFFQLSLYYLIQYILDLYKPPVTPFQSMRFFSELSFFH
jgi:hypothetical protein